MGTVSHIISDWAQLSQWIIDTQGKDHDSVKMDYDSHPKAPRGSVAPDVIYKVTLHPVAKTPIEFVDQLVTIFKTGFGFQKVIIPPFKQKGRFWTGEFHLFKTSHLKEVSK